MCYIEAWTPEDYESADADYDEDERDESSVGWDNDINYAITARLYRRFDANNGTNWERIRGCK